MALLGIYKLGISHSFTDHMDLTHCQSWSKSPKISLLLNHCQVYVCLDASVLQLISPAKPSSTGLQRETTCLNFFTQWYLVSISSRGYYFLNLQSPQINKNQHSHPFPVLLPQLQPPDSTPSPHSNFHIYQVRWPSLSYFRTFFLNHCSYMLHFRFLSLWS